MENRHTLKIDFTTIWKHLKLLRNVYFNCNDYNTYHYTYVLKNLQKNIVTSTAIM